MNSNTAKPLVHPSGAESTFSKVHRSLGRSLPLCDLDYFQGRFRQGAVTTHFHQDGANANYFEYQTVRGDCVLTALYDVKHHMTEWVQESLDNIRIGTALWAQSQLAKQLHCKMFVVVETDGDLPLMFYEIISGESVHRGTLTESEPAAVVEFWQRSLKVNP